MSGELKQAVQRRGSLMQTMRTVGWAFFGVRRRAGHEQALAEINPVHLVVAGLLAALLFIVVLVFLVRWVVGSGMAGV